MKALARNLSCNVNRRVVDRTGLNLSFLRLPVYRYGPSRPA